MRSFFPRLGSLLLATIGFSTAHAAQFDVVYLGLPPEAELAFQYATGIWADILVSPVPLKVRVNWFTLGTSTLGVTFPNGRRDFPSAPLTGTWYATSLANSIAGTELNPGETDFDIWFNSSANWSFDTTGVAVPGQHDFVSVALHEICHGLGFAGLAKKEGTTGSFGLLTASDFAPLFATFPWPQLDMLPSVFDRFLSHSQLGALTMMANPGTQLGMAFTSNQIYFNGPLAMAGNNGLAPRIYAPGTFALGSSCVHLNESTYPAGNANELMTPQSAAGDVDHWPGPICLNILRDIGWELTPEVGIHENSIHTVALAFYPNPASNELHLVTEDPEREASIIIMDAVGRTMRSTSDREMIDVSGLARGTYTLIRTTNDGAQQRGIFVKQ